MPIGAWHGNGRKVGWLSPFLLAAWDPVSEQYQSVCRCMSGFTDAFYTEVGGCPFKQVCIRLHRFQLNRNMLVSVEAVTASNLLGAA